MSYRKITVNGEAWTYKIGRTAAHIRSPQGRGTVVPIHGPGTRSEEDWEWRGVYYKRPVGPRHIRQWIESQYAM